MDVADLNRKKKELDQLAGKHKWNATGTDVNCGRVSYQDDLGVYRIDVYTSKMTVCILPAGAKPVYLKRHNFSMIDKILKNPYKY